MIMVLEESKLYQIKKSSC